MRQKENWPKRKEKKRREKSRKNWKKKEETRNWERWNFSTKEARKKTTKLKTLKRRTWSNWGSVKWLVTGEGEGGVGLVQISENGIDVQVDSSTGSNCQKFFWRQSTSCHCRHAFLVENVALGRQNVIHGTPTGHLNFLVSCRLRQRLPGEKGRKKLPKANTDKELFESNFQRRRIPFGHNSKLWGNKWSSKGWLHTRVFPSSPVYAVWVWNLKFPNSFLFLNFFLGFFNNHKIIFLPWIPRKIFLWIKKL